MSLNSIKDRTKSFASVFVKMGVLPIIFYLLLFLLLTYPAILLFSEQIWSGRGDGLKNLWNIWWINEAVTELHQSPWYTNYLHYPYGTSLLGHTLNPLKGFMAIPLLKFLSLTETYNFMILFSFVAGGFTSFLLAYYIVESYWSSMIAGFIFSFSNYHFAHARGHLGLVSLEWLPLFLLLWLMLLSRPRISVAIASAITLFAIFLSNYYYFLYSVLAALLASIWYAFRQKSPFFFLAKEHLLPLSTFVLAVSLTILPFVISFLALMSRDPLIGGHDPETFSLDLLALIIPGGHWRFADLTKAYWSKLPGFTSETSVHISISVLFLVIFVWTQRQKIQAETLGLWFLFLLFFTVMALGPVLQIWGEPVSPIPLPYSIFENIFPPLELSGVPIRMVVMTILSGSVVSAMGFKALFLGSRLKKLLAALLLVIIFVEYLPDHLPSSILTVPEYVYVLKDLPYGGVLDRFTKPPALRLFYQTIHDKPLAFVKIARLPTSVWIRDQELRKAIQSHDYATLCRDYNLRYLVADPATGLNLEYPWIRLIYQDHEVKLYDLGAEKGCSLAG